MSPTKIAKLTLDASTIGWMDFCVPVLNCDRDPKQWEAVESLISECGSILAFEKTCIICDRPIKLSFDSEYRLHAEGEPAIQFADGYSLHYYHGVPLPEKYRVHPHQWQTQWLLEERSISERGNKLRNWRTKHRSFQKNYENANWE